jgi:hypothetical protein
VLTLCCGLSWFVALFRSVGFWYSVPWQLQAHSHTSPFACLRWWRSGNSLALSVLLVR